ncbi:spermine oxidase-like [Scaptodrosophila lebanonensis]|uniref:Spermine oxidase-like n=1 Tax=Drosophila lebanonensis TaxID=7225 RepID=A0A6J2TM18_DROLE|nr:spermine oxidase-like [Scaptodrosophila lebanonensis]
MGACLSTEKKNKEPKVRTKYHASQRKDPKQLKSALENEPNILIIGAGVAGLACAIELKKYGFEFVHILESSGRIGGRIYTINFGDNTIDLGAQWVHGERGNAVFQMVYKLNLLDSSGDLFTRVDWIRSDGEPVPRALVLKLINLVTTIFENRHQDLADYDGTFNEYLQTKFGQELEKPAFQDVDRSMANSFLRAFCKMEGAAVESGIDQMSGSGFESYEPCPGDNMLNWRDKGFKKFLHVLLGGDEMNELGNLKDCVLFNQRVIRIEWDRMDGSVMVYCEGDQSYLADHVVISVSLGVLKKNSSLFVPVLPSDKRRAINFLGFGHICKIFIEFDAAFWPVSWPGFNVIWQEKDLEDAKNEELKWTTEIYAFYCTKYQPRVLQGWCAGECVEYIETLDSKTLTQGIITILKRFLPKMKIPLPKRVMTSKWTTNPAHLGAYSYPSMLTKSFNTGAEELAQPVNMLAYEPMNDSKMTIEPMTVRPVLLFCGEATSSNHYSTVHGAVESGLREAHRLAGYYLKDL